ncbi:multidrug efflux RND transporter permease subunit [Pseudomonas putida]|uniref:Efflux pump membrane transporter n=1 Tax=Pseudomonas putida TaxID=303 RepID=A0AA37VMN8_PSEPU|nr:efflux RND transporter permease subunit [Pseudomonas putida]GLO14547.1 multidrug efflux RND transporter permease subunit [Pseudomonas putida]GLO35086.1 multidrug efflux RND transporter permease subunit [Pseudomonas putida]HDS0963433.1 efflux RND transporter permease subunit [Pseudomonas putida]HDS0992799.1 efflux RND transporter permease subunit [Pseudomonas putida]
MARFFIDRPIFAWVIAILVMLAGGLAIFQLPLAQYPNIAPPQISLSATYTGASAKTMEDSVTQVIEQQMTGLDGLTYMSSSSSSAGSASITLTFEAGTDINTAQMLVQTKLEQAKARLPEAVQQQGIEIHNSASDFLIILSLVSDNPDVSATDISDFISSTLYDQISRVSGVGQVTTLGSSYAMRIWLDPDKLKQYALMPSDVSSALEAQNVDTSAGQLGALPARAGQQLNATLNARSKLQTAAQFRELVLKHNSAGAVVTLADVARVELGSESYDVVAEHNGRPSGGLAVSLATGANALDVSEAVQAKLAELEQFFPSKLQLRSEVAYNTAPFVKISIEEVVKTLFEAIALVVLIMYLFMQNLRATLIPAIAVPVVLLGTFGVLALLGYSINTLTMFGMVLAIGLLVDDAIVVVENVERIMAEKGLAPREATRQSMGEISGALVGIAVVLSAVFVPMAFFGGSTGVIYKQFSVTLVAAMTLSVLVAMTLTPALCATLLKPVSAHGEPRRGFFGWFNRHFERTSRRYQQAVGKVLARPLRGLLVYALVLGGVALMFQKLPSAFLPEEDQGMLMMQMTVPVGGTDERLQAVSSQVQDYMLQQPEVASILTVRGLGNGGNAQNSGRGFIKLKDWSERQGEEHSAAAVARRANMALSKILDANVFVIAPPAIQGLGQSSGFDVQLQDLAGLGHAELLKARDQFITLAAKDPRLANVRAQGLEDTPQLNIAIDDRKAGAMGVAASDINDTLSTVMGGSYVNDFVDAGRVKKVYLQGEADKRMLAEDIGDWYVRNDSDAMVPLSAFTSTSWSTASLLLERFNGFGSYELVGEPASGVSSGDAMAAVEQIMAQLPEGIGYAWAGQSYQERLAGNQAPLLYAISILFVFLCLAALYESWSVPFAVMLVVPVAILGALVLTGLRSLDNDVYFQVGLLTTVGLAAKNAILIIEFAKEGYERSQDLLAATLEAVRIRLRPVLMTSLAFILGVLPLALSSGAGAGGRQAIGTGVLGGMLAATVLGLFFIPLFYVLVQRLAARRSAPRTDVVAGEA